MMVIKINLFIISSLVAIFCTVMLSCTKSRVDGELIMDEELKDNLKTIQNSRIYFGHQSVGSNILDGINDILQKNSDVMIDLINFDQKQLLPKNYFAHSRIGKNLKPTTKCDDFVSILKHDLLKNIDIALLKFCFVDIEDHTNVKEVFNYYENAVKIIKKNNPNLVLVHVTVPLTTVQKDWKVPIKKILGKKIAGYNDNMKRFQYNTLLRETFHNEPIFDIAKTESTYPDGRREFFYVKKKKYFCLIDNYSNDGGHLNKTGKQLCAKVLIKTLAETVSIVGSK